MDDDYLFSNEYLKQIQDAAHLSDIVYDAIKEAIVTGKLSPGLKLKQIDLATRFSVSQQTIREALKRLVISGWVVQKPNRGFAVAEISFKEQDDLFELRSVLESYAIDKAVDLMSDEDLTRMREILPFTDSPNGKLSEKTIRENNYEFHMIPIRAINNLHLTRIVENIWDLLWIYQLRSEDREIEKKAAIKMLDQHEEILVALENRDRARARQAITAHLDRLKEGFHELRKIR